jgi:glucans biosynthesis protein
VGRRGFLGRVVGTGCGIAALAPASLTLAPAAASGQDWTPAMPGTRFGFDQVRELARRLAAAPFSDTTPAMPEELAALSPETYHAIAYREEEILWRGEGSRFQVKFFPRGSFFHRQVTINVIEGGEVKPLPYDPSLFDFGSVGLQEAPPPDLGYAGFRLLYPLNVEDHFDEVASFLGASYFRVVAAGQHYGLSARGLAIDTGLAKKEEFPFFREYWLKRPQANSRTMEIYALLDSESVTGAYHFTLTPGQETTVDVRAEVYTRAAVEKLGLAPLTSMFFYGENTTRHVDDLRPEVHDSDGMLMSTGAGEWIWRPLANRKDLQISSFADQNPQGFGLMQRDRDRRHYLDLEYDYETRPSAWVEPADTWGQGSAQLIEIPTNSERHDNIVLFWVPDQAVEPGQVWPHAYRLRFGGNFPDMNGTGRTLATREAGAEDQELRRFGIEFGGGPLSDLPEDENVGLVVTASGGKVHSPRSRRDPESGIWYSVFSLDPEDEDAIELRAFLNNRDHALTETWSYLWKRS